MATSLVSSGMLSFSKTSLQLYHSLGHARFPGAGSRVTSLVKLLLRLGHIRPHLFGKGFRDHIHATLQLIKHTYDHTHSYCT